MGREVARRWPARRSWLPAFLMTGVVVGAALACARDLPGDLDEKLAYGMGLRRAHVALGKRLSETSVSGSKGRIALLDVGAVAYHSEWSVIDTFGLNEPHIARGGRGDAHYVLAQHPDIVVVVSSNPDRYEPVFDYEQPLFDASLSEGFIKVESLEFTPDYHLWVLAKPGGIALGEAGTR